MEDQQATSANFLTVVIRLPEDAHERATMVAELKFGSLWLQGSEVSAMGLGDALAELESLGR